jgi:hypothetical protein
VNEKDGDTQPDEATVLTVYHRTFHSAAILREGFRDSGESVIRADADTGDAVELLPGVWVSAEHPLDENEGAYGDAVIELTVPVALFEKYEWVEEGKSYRESMIPAAELNAYMGTARVVTDKEDPRADGGIVEGR